MSWLIEHLTIISAIIAALGALGAGVGTYLAQQDQTRLYQRLAAKSDEIATLNRDLAKKSEDIAELNRTIAASVTGGDSFSYLAFSGDGQRRHLVLIGQGKYPLYDVAVRIVDVTKPGLTPDALMGTQINGGNLAANMAKMIGEITIPNGDEAKYNIFISARNGFVMERLRLRKVSGAWKTAMKVQRGQDSDGTVLREQVDATFPRNQTGEVDW